VELGTFLAHPGEFTLTVLMSLVVNRYVNKKLSYCWETARRESLPKIAEMDVEMKTYLK